VSNQTIAIILIALVVVIIPAIVGGRLASLRGRNPLLWGTACGIFPIFLLVSWFNKPIKEVPGGFRICPGCKEWIRWKDPSCRYCGAEQASSESRSA